MKCSSKIRSPFVKTFYLLILGVSIQINSQYSLAQCSNWSISATAVSSASCAANGAFIIKLHGTDVANLSNIEYGIPLQTNGFSVPLNSDSNFNGIPPGVIKVTVIADCGGASVGRTIPVTIPGYYNFPKIVQPDFIPTLSCRPSGKISGIITDGAAPFTCTLKSWPAAYTGIKQYTDTVRSFSFSDLPSGNYAVQVIDACNSGTALQTYSVTVMAPSTAIFYGNSTLVRKCDSLTLYPPTILGGDWSAYFSDTGFKYSINIGGGAIATTPFTQVKNGINFSLKSPYTTKDAYAGSFEYTFQFPCGTTRKYSVAIRKPRIFYVNNQNCDSNFSLTLSFSSNDLVCFPITYTLRNIYTNQVFGPNVFAGNIWSKHNTPTYPLGTYYLVYTTSDGYKDSTLVSTKPLTGSPYTVSILSQGFGLNNYADAFVFSTYFGDIGGIRTVELFSGPPGYTYKSTWSGASQLYIFNNGFPTAQTLKFPPGNYVWKITDDCGVYYLNISFSNADVCQFSIGTPSMQQTCQGLKITPTGTVVCGGVPTQIGFFLYRDGAPYYISSGGTTKWPVYTLGSTIILTEPGLYTIVPTVYNNQNPIVKFYNPTGFYLRYPNKYTNTYTFNYVHDSLSIDNNHTQGFMCKGATPGNAFVALKGQGGIPFQAPIKHYKYSLSLPGKIYTGPLIATNDSGLFSGFGGNARDSFDVKVQDSCSAFAVQRIHILDLNNTRAISSSAYLACAGEDVQLSAIFLPNATYSWIGPGGFSSSLRNPIIPKINASKTGIYRVTVSSSACGLPVTDSVRIAIAPPPPKPLLSFTCLPRPVKVNITNPSPGIGYQWDIGIMKLGYFGQTFEHTILVPSDTLFQKSVLAVGSYTAIAIDSLSQCTTKSDSLEFLSDPTKVITASIYNAHNKLCIGDTTTLVALGYQNAQSPKFQWFRNNVSIPGADSATLIISTAGRYRVAIDGGLCNVDTSKEDTITVVPPPSASITASSKSICSGDSATLTANAGVGLSYSWQFNGFPILKASTSVYKATNAGSYNVIVSNGACVAISPIINLSIIPSPIVKLSPSGVQKLCPGQTIALSTASNPAWTYTWLRNGTILPGANSNAYTASTPGIYFLKVSTANCPSVYSDSVTVALLETSIHLGNDTVICDKNFQFPLSVNLGFTKILWSTGETSQKILVTKAGKYWVEASNKCGIFRDTIKILDASDLLPNWPNDTTICNTGGYTYFGVSSYLNNVLWSTGNTSHKIRVDSPAIIWMTADGPCGPVKDTMNIHFCKPAISKLALSKKNICEGECINLHAEYENFPTSFQWNFPGGHPENSIAIQPSAICYSLAGTYPITLIAQNKFGADTAETEVIVTAQPHARFEDTLLSIPYKTNLDLPACGDAINKDWYLGDSLICANCATLLLNARNYQTVYRCVLRNGDCSDSCHYAIQVVDIPNDLWLPDAFTPNGDGRNDIFHVITDNPNIRIIGLIIYNRWGQQVFASNQSKPGWDGKLNNQTAAAGTYFWQLQYKVADGKDKLYFKKGDVLLIR